MGFEAIQHTMKTLLESGFMLVILTGIACRPLVVQATGVSEPAMIYIPEGPFLYGSSQQERSHYRASQQEPKAQTIHLPAYWIGKYEITRDEYSCFIEDGGYFHPEYWSEEGWEYRIQYNWNIPRRFNDDDYLDKRRQEIMPVCSISWYEAEAFCRWLAIKTLKPYRLPTEQEWEKAARGTDGRIFPWGNQWDGKKCNWYGYLGEVIDSKEETDPFLYTSPVGSFEEGKSPYGCYDMAGNVLEWCSNRWANGSPYRVLRGGCFFSNNPRLLRCAWRGGNYPDIGHVYWGIIGFRVARDTMGES